MRYFSICAFLLASGLICGQEQTRTITVNEPFLNIPVEMTRDRGVMSLTEGAQMLRQFDIRLADGAADYWVFVDLTPFTGKTLTLSFSGERAGLARIYQSDAIAGADSLYSERNRPQVHFTSRRGWNNDPNGLVFYDGEYHLFYQHNPYGTLWGNMHWGHAVSKDLVHWEELGDVLYPDELGTMFSGSAAVDRNNTGGWQHGGEKTIIAAYTADGPERQVQCIAYSNDRGRSFTKYAGNPVLDSRERWKSRSTRDPKIFWHEPLGRWVMVLFEELGHSIYHSADLKEWDFVSHLEGYWECPELFELPVDGDAANTRWVIYGASGTYQIGTFDGYRFNPLTDKLRYFAGEMYAAQTYNDIPAGDGRRIQIGWGRITHPGMPFNQMMCFPTELTLRTTRNGIRLFSEPVREIEQLYRRSHTFRNLSTDEANRELRKVEGGLFHIRMTVEPEARHNFRFFLDGEPILHYTFNRNELNGYFYEASQTDRMRISFEMIIDRTSLEIFADHGRFSLIEPLARGSGGGGLEFRSRRDDLRIHSLEVHELKSIW